MSDWKYKFNPTKTITCAPNIESVECHPNEDDKMVISFDTNECCFIVKYDKDVDELRINEWLPPCDPKETIKFLTTLIDLVNAQICFERGQSKSLDKKK